MRSGAKPGRTAGDERAVRRMSIPELNEPGFIDLGEDYDAALLDQVYREIYLPAFPIRDEQEDPTIWTPRLLDANSHPRLCFLIAGEALADPARRRVSGLLVAEFYAASACVLVSYLAVAADARRQGLAKKLFAELGRRIDAGRVSRGLPVAAVFAEIHDPQAAAAQADVLDPQARLRVMAGLGGRRIPVEYVQPALGPDQSPAGGLWLIAFPALASRPHALTVQRVRDFLVEFYLALDVENPQTHPDFRATFASVDALAGLDTSAALTLLPLIPDAA